MHVSHIAERHMVAALIGCALVLALAGPVGSEPGLASHFRQVAPLRRRRCQPPCHPLPYRCLSLWNQCLALFGPLSAGMIRPADAIRLFPC
jgi:hypothetical protein